MLKLCCIFIFQANWTVKSTTSNSISMEHVSPSGDQGYPGTLTATVTYTLTDSNEVTITYGAVTDATTIVNLVNHTYFNLAGKVRIFIKFMATYLSLSLSLSL